MSANILATSSIVAKEGLAILENMLSFSTHVNRDWEDEYASNKDRGYAPGATINIKRPPRYTYRNGRVAAPQNTVESSLPLVLTQGGCDIAFTSIEKTVSLTQLEKKLQAAIAPVANEIDRQGLELARLATFNTLGTPGVAPATQALALAAVTDVNARLDDMAAPRDKQRAFVMNPRLNASMIQGFAGLFNSNDKISKQYGSGMMVDSLGIAYAMDQNVDTHVNGTQAVAGTAVTAGQTGAAIAVAALTGTVTRGTVVTFPGVFAVNPQSRRSTGQLAQFVVTADVAAAATVLPVSPALVATGAFQNVSNATTAGSFAIFGAAGAGYSANVGFHKDAFTLACVPLVQVSSGTGAKSSTASSNGFTIRVTEGYDVREDLSIMRLDVLFGWAATYPELACKYAF